MEHLSIHLTDKEVSMVKAAMLDAEEEAARLEQEGHRFDETLGARRASITSFRDIVLDIAPKDTEDGEISLHLREWKMISRSIQLILKEMTATELDVRTTYSREEYEELDGKLVRHICRK